MSRWYEFIAAAALGTTASAALAQPANDDCPNATLISDGTWAFDLRNATTDGEPSQAALSFYEEPDVNDVWFEYVATADGVLAASTCGTSFSTVAIYSECYSGELASSCVGTPEGFCPFSFAGDARLNVTAGQRVLIRVAIAGFGTPKAGNLVVRVLPTVTSCIEIPSDAIDEGEACGETINDSCWAAVEVSSTPAVYAGTMVADFPIALDHDFYHIAVTEPKRLRITLNSDVPTMIMRLLYADPSDPDACTGSTFRPAFIQSEYLPDRCETGEMVVEIGPGDYYLELFTDTGVGYPCGDINNYLLSFETEDIGSACMLDGTCVVTTEIEAIMLGAQYNGDGVPCATYSLATSSSAYEDISATGLPGPDSDPFDYPENNSVVSIGFNFTFFANTYSTVSISTSGFLQFGDNPIKGSAFNFPIPTTVSSAPGNAIFGLWDALVTGTDPSRNGSGSIVYQTVGSAPDRRFIAQWTGVGQQNFGGILTPEGGPVSFQIVLHESTNQVELRYLDITADPGDGNSGGADYTIGVQDASGIFGTSVDSYTVVSGAALILTPTANCSPCPADFDNTGFVDTDDFDAFVRAFEAGTQDADFDGSGFVDTDDFDAFVHAFESGC